MKNISDVDKNFKVKTTINKKDIAFHDAKNPPFVISGLLYENGKFRRIPEKIAESVNDGVKLLHSNTAGGRVRFKTNSPYIAINAKMCNIGKMPHFPLTGSAGFDCYEVIDGKEEHYRTFVPPFEIEDGYESIIEFKEIKEREITINFPLYSDVCNLYIGVAENSMLASPSEYKTKRNVVYYGSSITQGGCASRPGNSYQAIISRELNCDYINLGFAGSARGEEEIAEYIASLNMGVFVYDYDYNAPDVSHLEKTHKKMFDIIREKNPKLPIVMISRPGIGLDYEETMERLDIIKRTYESAIAAGDKNVYFVSGQEIFNFADKSTMLVDAAHPNDFGFWCFAQVLMKTLKELL